MKTPDPDPSMQHGQPDKLDAERLPHQYSSDSSSDPLNTLLANELDREIDNERLYTDEFIRANENASRSLFLGFLGIALLGTTLFAWFVLSQPKPEEDLIPPESNSVPVPLPPSSPNLNTEPPPLIPGDSSLPSGTTITPNTGTTPSTGTTESPLVFPVNPVRPEGNTSPIPITPSPSPSDTTTPSGAVDSVPTNGDASSAVPNSETPSTP